MTDTQPPYTLTATEALRRIEAGSLLAMDWVLSCHQRIRLREPEVCAWASLDDDVIGQAETRLRQGQGPLIPVGVKDIIDVCGMPTRMGTDFHGSGKAVREGGSVALMRDAGCLFMGKTVTTELGHLHSGPTRNPLALHHTPGGSSSGSAAAVADLMVPLCLGTQTSGSVIRPASYCGVIGYKPTYNDFDKSNILPNAPSMDTLGILARSVDDVGLLRGILLEETTDGIHKAELSRLTFGLVRATPWETATPETRDHIEGFMEELAGAGARIADIELENEVSRLLELHRLISGYEFRRSIAFERIHHLEQLSPVLRNGRLADGHAVDNRTYQKAIREVATLRRRLAKVFSEVDILVTPSATGPAPASLTSTGGAAFSSAWTLAGNPAISLPLLQDPASNLPVGCQFVAGFGNDDLLLAGAKSVMEAIGNRYRQCQVS